MHLTVSCLNSVLSHLQFGQDRIAHLPLTAHLVSPKLLRRQHSKEKAMLSGTRTNIYHILQHVLSFTMHHKKLHCIWPTTWCNVKWHAYIEQHYITQKSEFKEISMGGALFIYLECYKFWQTLSQPRKRGRWCNYI